MQRQGLALVIEHFVVMRAVKLQALADTNQTHVGFGERLSAVAAFFDLRKLSPGATTHFLAYPGPRARLGVDLALAADVHKVVRNVFLVAKMQRRFRLAMDWIDSGNFKSCVAQCLKQSLPDRALLVGVMEREDKQSACVQRVMRTVEDRSESFVKILPALAAGDVFDDLCDLLRIFWRKPPISRPERQT